MIRVAMKPYWQASASTGRQLVRWAFCKDREVVEEGIRRLAAGELRC